MEMEGRGYSEFYRNTSEELFIKTMMESSIGMPAPTMEMLGFKNLTQNFRTDSEELFKSWLTNGENNGPHPTGMGPRPPRQASRRISTETSGLANQSMAVAQKKSNDDILFQQTSPIADDSSNSLDPNRIAVEKGLQASNMFLAKAWFHSSQPMTRSRSSELRRRYVAMQNSQTPIGMEALHDISGSGANSFKQENANGFNNITPICENSNQFNTFMSPSNSSSSTFNNPQMETVDKVSSVVSMLKGTLERKRLTNYQAGKEAIQDNSFAYYNVQETFGNASLHQDHGTIVYENQENYQNATSTIGIGDNAVLRTIEESLMEGIMDPVIPNQMKSLSRETSQSESSTAPPVVSRGFDMCEDPCVSAQTPSGESSKTLTGNGRSPEYSARTKDLRERRYDYSKDDLKKGGIIRHGSVTSSGSADKGDTTKRRRVERSRKMAEAKERNSTPAVPSDMQSILKRCENLEKEVRSLKLNLAFMNRKDSEQTKQIEELQNQNQELTEEKRRLLEEIERIISETGKM